MPVSHVPVLDFRALQAVTDLRAVVGRQPQAAIRGISERVPPADRDRGANTQALVRVTLRQGCRLETDADRPLLDALLLAASQPAADPTAFACATAILLADRLQGGLGEGDLGDYWEAFGDDYLQLGHHDRAAIVQGFLAGQASGLILMQSAAPAEARFSLPETTVRADLLALARRDLAVFAEGGVPESDALTGTLANRHLKALLAGSSAEPLTGDSLVFAPLLGLASRHGRPAYAGATALLLNEALRSQDDEGWFSVTLWGEHIGHWLSLDASDGRPILSGLRHLYESEGDWSPLPRIEANPRMATGLPLLPILDATYNPRAPGTRMG